MMHNAKEAKTAGQRDQYGGILAERSKQHQNQFLLVVYLKLWCSYLGLSILSYQTKLITKNIKFGRYEQNSKCHQVKK